MKHHKYRLQIECELASSEPIPPRTLERWIKSEWMMTEGTVYWAGDKPDARVSKFSIRAKALTGGRE